MTGYGRGECSQNGFKITVELSSVNRKQREISVTLPREMEMLEAQIRDIINQHVSRGRLTVRVPARRRKQSLRPDAPERSPGQGYARELDSPGRTAQACPDR